MPVFLDKANLVFDKQRIEKKYNGGCRQFREDWDIANSNVHQEDDELFCLCSMNIVEFKIDRLISSGLDYNDDVKFSQDFVAISRYGSALWKTNWLSNNSTFAWHADCDLHQKERAIEIGEKMTMEKIQEMRNKGINLFQTIK